MCRLLANCGSRITIAALAVLTFVPAARAADEYYMMVFSWQGTSMLPRTAHTFATFVHASGEGNDPEKYKLESRTISWLPASLDIKVLRRFAEQGRNLDLDESLAVAKSLNARVTMWGPHRIQKEVYDRAAKRVEELNSGALRYKALDGPFRAGGGVTNCIHAVSDIDTDNGVLDTGTAYGDAASALVARHFKRWMIEPDKTHPWVAERLGVGKASVTVP